MSQPQPQLVVGAQPQQASPAQNYSQSRMVWFRRTGPLTQALFTLPLIGFVTGQQAIIIVAVGMPVLFGILSATGDVAAAVVPFIGIIVWAMIRPPVMSYEARLFTLLRFHLIGGTVKTKQKKKGAASSARRSRFLSRPGSSAKKKKKGKKAGADEEEEEEAAGDEGAAASAADGAPPPETEAMEVGTYPGMPVEVDITLRDRSGHTLTRRRVGIMLDGQLVRTAMSSTSGSISILIDPEAAIGTRLLSICEVGQDGTTPASTIIEKKIVFVPRTRGGR